MNEISYRTIAAKITEATGINDDGIIAWLKNDTFGHYDIKAITQEICDGQSIPANEDVMVFFMAQGTVSDADVEWLNN